MSRFVFLSVLLAAYSGLTLGLILWNSSGGGSSSSSSGGSRTEERDRRTIPVSQTVGRTEARANTAAGKRWGRQGESPAGLNEEPAPGRDLPGNGGLGLQVVGSGEEQRGGAGVYAAGGAHDPGARGATTDAAQKDEEFAGRGSVGPGVEVREGSAALVPCFFPLALS